MQKDIDIIIYGATGFTGQLCVKYFQSLNTEVKWAMAGRNHEKLQQVAQDHSVAVEILIADSDDAAASPAKPNKFLSLVARSRLFT